MGLELQYIEGQTPIDQEEKEGLLIKTITTKQELDEHEQQNIEKAVEWTMKKKNLKYSEILTESFVKQLHYRMFSDVWKWAGSFRKTNKNLGVEWHQISIDLKNLLDDCNYWIQNNTFSGDEIAIRFKHLLVSIHPFPNGNGRHSRLMADVLIHNRPGKEVFTWGGGNQLVKASDIRSAYISALRDADRGNYDPLINFART
jgi:Fic-DOC domain mobile mystery protein B